MARKHAKYIDVPNIRKMPARARFKAHISIDKYGCWVWAGCTVSNGYTVFGDKGKRYQAHRYSYMIYVDTQIKGVLHHLCENKRCVNPQHLVDITGKLHSQISPNWLAYKKARQTQCINGHLLAGSNVLVRKDGRRNCKACGLISAKKYRQKQFAKKA